MSTTTTSGACRVHDDRVLFEFLILEGAQAGLSWATILRKRENYRAAFDGFDPAKVAPLRRRKVRRLLADAGIVRNRLKIESRRDATPRHSSPCSEEFGSFDALHLALRRRQAAAERAGRTIDDVPRARPSPTP